jgi:hypothetical protein
LKGFPGVSRFFDANGGETKIGTASQIAILEKPNLSALVIVAHAESIRSKPRLAARFCERERDAARDFTLFALAEASG